MDSTLLSERPIHLGTGATAVIEPPFTGELSWYEGYLERHEADGVDARLVSAHTFTAPWDVWEMHPNGAEVVICVSGSMTLLQERSGGTVSALRLEPGEYAINEAGTWHSADVEDTATVIFITAGLGTEHRPRT
jgi:quercetin dioxygenase-like cupin family protein